MSDLNGTPALLPRPRRRARRKQLYHSQSAEPHDQAFVPRPVERTATLLSWTARRIVITSLTQLFHHGSDFVCILTCCRVVDHHAEIQPAIDREG